ncbi:MAG TPA: Hsp20/alpha crystallin family protein [Aurantimonas coralicida]|uniref:Hsp20/alpha crystallin family protein n=2 Tax=root TaxID=1 RepID=A0A9C9NET2_9HYPH|nr:Hsp20/alpha crystallin family protein [Aurantimonas coralicida]HEU00029.1 Hsp20/alpha crystallin family protein [Aurantimonas coralicida]
MAQEIVTTQKEEVDRGNRNGEATRASVVYRPMTDIFETEDHVVLVTDMPGVGAGDVEVTLERRVLTLRGHVEPPAPEGYRQVYAEYGVGDFERVFTLSEDIDQDRISANQKDGVLTLELPKAASVKPKKITIKVA